MNKLEKRRDKQIVKALTVACEAAKDKVSGFDWLTHTVNHKRLDNSLMIHCVFSTDEALADATKLAHDHTLTELICQELAKIGVVFKHANRHILFDSEQACDREHNGNWERRLSANH